LGLAVLDVAGIYGARRRTAWTTQPAFTSHVLAVAQLLVDLTAQARDGVAELLTFDGEPKCWRRFTGANGAAAMLKPDAYVRVGVGAIERSAFVEVDQGTERAPTLTRKLDAFTAYWRSGIEQQTHGVFPLVLWLVPDEKRTNTLWEVVHKMTNETQQLFTVALQRDGARLMTAPAGEGV
jgi:hypothetical protein